MTRTEKYFRHFETVEPAHIWTESCLQETAYWFAVAVRDCPANLISHMEKRSRFESIILDHVTLDVNELELLVGRRSGLFHPTEEQLQLLEEYSAKKEALCRTDGWGTNSTNHRVLDNEKLLRVGISGVLAEIDSLAEQLTPAQPDYMEKLCFYRSSQASLRAVVRLAGRYRALLLERASTAAEPRRGELITMAEVLAQVPEFPARTFREAMQSMWLVQFALCLVEDIVHTGRFDNYMYPFYQRDLAQGILTRQEALELIEQLYYKHNEIYTSWPGAIMVCGEDREGRPVCNELSYLCVEAIGTVGLVNPSVNVAWREDLPEDFMDLCLQQITAGRTRPAFFNDRVIQEGLRDAGLSPEDARYYIHSTCVEITPIAASDVRVATPYININKVFEYMLGGGAPIFGESCHIERDLYVPPETLTDFDAFREKAFDCVREMIRVCLEDVIRDLYVSAHDRSSPLASALINDCLARGRDAGSGGARYAMAFPCFPGFINFIDALAAVKKAVYQEKKVTLAQLADALRGNFSDERLRLYLLNACPKFGNDDPETDTLGEQLYALIREELPKYRTAVGATFHPSFFAWIMHGKLGAQAAASPDGRRQGEALSEHLGAMQGRDKAGPLAVVRSIARLPQKYGIGGIATNFRFSQNMVSSEEGRQALKTLIRYFMDEGCFEMQFNVVCQADLLDAQQNPERHRTLMVRVAGYSDYFVNLDPVIQAEILKRNEHDGL